MNRLMIIDSTTVSLFSNAIFKSVGRHPKTGRKKGGIKVHSVIHANEGVPCDVQFTSAATNDSLMPAPRHYSHGRIIAMERAYINYAKFEELSGQYRERIVVFRKGETSHIARIITYVDIRKGRAKLISLPTNDFDMDIETVIEIYRHRWKIESLFKQIKQNFPLR